MFDFLKKKPKPEAEKPASPAMAEPPAQTAEADAAGDAAEVVDTREAVKQTVGKSFFARTFGGLFSRHPQLDPELLDELETALISADVGVRVSAEIMVDLRKRLKASEFANSAQRLETLRAQ